MSSATKTTKTYTYRSGAGGNADVSIEYSADLSALSRLEVRNCLERNKSSNIALCCIISSQKFIKREKMENEKLPEKKWCSVPEKIYQDMRHVAQSD